MNYLKLYLFLALGLMSCQNSAQNDEAHSHEGDTEQVPAAESEEVHLMQQQMDVMDIKLGSFQYLNLRQAVQANGRLELPPQNKASLSAVLGGRVKKIYVLEGDKVRKGQILAEMEHPSFIQLQSDFLKSKAEYDYTLAEFERQDELLKDNISSSREFQIARSKFKTAEADYQGLTAQLKLLAVNPAALEGGKLYTTFPVPSPINGFVRLIEVNTGKYVVPEQEMFEIVDNEHIHIDLKVFEKDLLKIRDGQKVIFSLSSKPDSTFEGSIFSVGKAFEEKSKAMLVHAEIDNKSGDLLPGMYVDARIITHEEKVRSLPDEAIVSNGGLDYIFVLKPLQSEGGHEDEHIFRKIEVSTGLKDIGFTEVVPAYNLPEHVQIVTKGAFYLMAELQKGEGGHGHHH